ncbi:MAG TPA: PilZ domain-containing protein [Rhodopila sp.]|nr:PilZ domain-containing protein [Rhodopila sp.]
METDFPCELLFGGVRYNGRLINLSSGGARVAVDAALSVGMTVEIRVPALEVATRCTVVSGEDQEFSLSAATPIAIPADLRSKSPRAA